MLLIKSLLVLCTATAVLAKDRFDAISSIGYFSGQDISDPEDTGYPVFARRRNSGSAVASIVQRIANISDFRPAKEGYDLEPSTYGKFIYGLVNYPALQKTENLIVRLDLTGPVDQLVKEIQYIFDILEKDEDYPFDSQIANNFRKLVPTYLKNKDQYRWLLNQVAIHKVQYFDKLRIELTRVTLKMAEDKETGLAYIPEQVATLSRDVFTVDTKWIHDHATKLSEEIDTVTVEQALTALTTRAHRREGFVDDRSFCEMSEKKEEYEFFGRSRFNLQKLRL
ncbi:hypothetical protein BGZ72_008215 [Mortierella alpina]|nr:hypothetical protein BGZ72_008215 [Mortierella alpina]